MDKYYKEKKDQLGMHPSTARNRLIKSLLFDMATKCGMNICVRCKKEIEDIDQFTIEHIEPWLYSDDPSSLYFDLSNIGFSHQACNSSAARRGKADSVFIECDGCGENFTRDLSTYKGQLKRGQSKFFCSEKCYYANKGYSRLSRAEIEEVRSMSLAGASTRNIANHFGISHVAVHNCVTGKTYK